MQVVAQVLPLTESTRIHSLAFPFPPALNASLRVAKGPGLRRRESAFLYVTALRASFVAGPGRLEHDTFQDQLGGRRGRK